MIPWHPKLIGHPQDWSQVRYPLNLKVYTFFWSWVYFAHHFNGTDLSLSVISRHLHSGQSLINLVVGWQCALLNVLMILCFSVGSRWSVPLNLNMRNTWTLSHVLTERLTPTPEYTAVYTSYLLTVTGKSWVSHVWVVSGGGGEDTAVYTSYLLTVMGKSHVRYSHG